MMENHAPHLPQEVITNILVRLPVKSLIRFQCVCKEWKNMFKTPSFTAEHLSHSTQKIPLLAVDCIISESNHWHLCSVNGEMQVVEFQNENPYMTDSEIESICSSNGLLFVELIVKSRHAFWLWNPSIRKFRQVPNSGNNENSERGRYTVGFGFSPVVDDYKVVKLFRSQHSIVHVEVFSLRTGLWKKVGLGNLEGIDVTNTSFACNGSIFWFGQKGDYALIVSFDVAMEVFTLIPFPMVTSFPVSFLNSLTMYQNELAMLCPTLDDIYESYSIDLWVLEEATDPSKGRWTWTKFYSSRPNPYNFSISPNIIWGDEIVCAARPIYEPENHESHLVLCNVNTDEFDMFAIPKRSNSVNMFDYVESLVLLDYVDV